MTQCFVGSAIETVGGPGVGAGAAGSLAAGPTGFRLFTGTYYRGLDYVQVRPAHAYILSAYPRVRRVIMLTYSVDAGALERSRIHTL